MIREAEFRYGAVAVLAEGEKVLDRAAGVGVLGNVADGKVVHLWVSFVLNREGEGLVKAGEDDQGDDAGTRLTAREGGAGHEGDGDSEKSKDKTERELRGRHLVFWVSIVLLGNCGTGIEVNQGLLYHFPATFGYGGRRSLVFFGQYWNHNSGLTRPGSIECLSYSYSAGS